VLRVDDPHRPELPAHLVDGLIGKASTLLDAGTAAGREVLHRLVVLPMDVGDGATRGSDDLEWVRTSG
jgi:hypothetical protein